MQGFDHLLELGHLLPTTAGGRERPMGGEVGERIVAPVVGQTDFQQVRLAGELMDGQQLDGRDTQLGQMSDRRWMCHSGVGPAQFLGYLRVQLGEPFDVGFVDHRASPGGSRVLVRTPVEFVPDSH